MALTDNLVAYYKLDETSGTTVTASVGTNGTTYNTPTWVSGKINNGLNFVGASTQYVSIPTKYGFTNVNATLACWVYLADTSKKGLFVKIGDTSWNGFAFGVGSGDMETNGNTLLGLYENVRWFGATSIGTGWHHVAMSINSSGVPSLWLDGSLISAYAGTNAINPGDDLTKIGGYVGAGGLSRYLTGIVDEVGIWSRELSSGEISQLYNSGNGLSYPFIPTQPLSL